MNIVGEVTLWVGMFLLCINGFTAGWNWVSIISPIFVFFLLYFGSGVRLLEASSDKRYVPSFPYQYHLIYLEKTGLYFPVAVC
jgi:steroid 5-alpha reductase family enzyme